MAESIQLVKLGKPLFCLKVHPTMDGHFLREPTQELLGYLRRALAAPPKWYSEHGAPQARLVLEFRPNCGLAREAFTIEADAAALRLRASSIEGLWHAVYFFLEQAFGIRWLWPGDSGEVVPQAVDVTWPIGAQTHEPDWLWRRHGLGGSFWAEQDYDLAWRAHCGATTEAYQALERWHRRMRLGGLHIGDGHRWGEICSPLEYGESHPEYFALINGQRDTAMRDGKHGNQPCTSNPEVVQLVADYIKSQFRARPELDGFSMALNDGYGFCECEQCREIDAWAGEATAVQKDAFDAMTADGQTDAGGMIITDRIMKFANAVAELVAADYPDKLLVILIYSVYRQAPRRVKLHPNVMTQFCTATWSWTDPATEEAEIGILDRLGRYSKHIGIYDYLANGANGSMPRGFTRTLARALKTAYRKGARYYATQPGNDFALEGSAYYLLARVLWDVDADPEAILDDFCRSGFGPAAAQIKHYLNAYMEVWEGARIGMGGNAPRMEQQLPQLYPEQWRAARRADLGRAAELCGSNPEQLTRVEFLVRGLDFLDLYCAAAQHAVRLIEAGVAIPFDAQQFREWLQADGRRAQLIEETIAWRDRLLEWTKAHRNQFVYAEVWFHYQLPGGLLGGLVEACAVALRAHTVAGG